MCWCVVGWFEIVWWGGDENSVVKCVGMRENVAQWGGMWSDGGKGGRSGMARSKVC